MKKVKQCGDKRTCAERGAYKCKTKEGARGEKEDCSASGENEKTNLDHGAENGVTYLKTSRNEMHGEKGEKVERKASSASEGEILFDFSFGRSI